MFDNYERVFNFGKRVEISSTDILKKASEMGGIESDILRTFHDERIRITLQAEIGGGVIAEDRLLLARLKEDTLSQLSEHGIEVSGEDLDIFDSQS